MEYLKNLPIGVFIDLDSGVHRLDARLKIAILGIILALVFVLNHWFDLGLLAVLLLAAFFLSRLPLKFVLRGFSFVILLSVIAFLFNLFLTPGKPLWQWHFLKISREGFSIGLLMVSRILLIVLAASLLTFTTSYLQLIDALEALFKPFKRFGIPAHEIAMIMSIALRFLPILLLEAEKIVKAQTSRGAQFDQGNPFKRAMLLLPLLVPLFVHALKVAEDLAVAMEARCYQGGEGRTSWREMRFKPADWWTATGFIVFVIVILGKGKFV